MPRTARQTAGGFVYHALNRAAAGRTLFRKAADFAALVRVLDEALDKHPLRVLAYCVMPTHWHFVLCPKRQASSRPFFAA
jgi:putative transposase